MAKLLDLCCVPLVLGCSGSAVVALGPGDTGGDASDVSVGDAVLDSVPSDAADCSLGASVSRPVGPGGDTLRLCGASITVAPGAFSRWVTLGITRVEEPRSPPFERAWASPFFRLTTDEAVLPGPATVTLPHDGVRGIKELVRVSEAGLEGVEVCSVTDREVQKQLDRLGTFAVMRDLNAYPNGPAGLGEATLTYSFGGNTATTSLGSGYAVFVRDEHGVRSVQLHSRRLELALPTVLDVRFVHYPEGLGALLSVTYTLVGGESWSWVSPVDPGGGAVMFESAPDARLRGSLLASLRNGSQTRRLEATFDAMPVLFRFPPELECP